MTREEIQKRLDDIGAQNLSTLSDEAALALLEERKTLQAQLEVFTNEETAAKQQAKEREERQKQLAVELEKLNDAIRPEVSDDELIQLVEQRKALETELQSLKTPKKVHDDEEVHDPVKALRPIVPVAKRVLPPEPAEQKESPLPVSSEDERGIEAVETGSLDPEEYHEYLEDLKSNINDLGTFLQHLPDRIRQNKAFMLEVAKIDPAYAMHYADKASLARDEYFVLQVAGMQNARNTGNPLSEMLPEMRTEKVVLEGTKQDYRNVRFARPEMSNYDEIREVAKKGALEAVSALKNSHDIKLLIPPLLQKDKAFMAEIETQIQQADNNPT